MQGAAATTLGRALWSKPITPGSLSEWHMLKPCGLKAITLSSELRINQSGRELNSLIMNKIIWERFSPPKHGALAKGVIPNCQGPMDRGDSARNPGGVWGQKAAAQGGDTQPGSPRESGLRCPRLSQEEGTEAEERAGEGGDGPSQAGQVLCRPGI